MFMTRWLVFPFFLVLMLLPNSAASLTPDEILVIANNRYPGSVELARYYMQVRGVPQTNLIRLDVVTDEVMSRQDYNNKVRDPVRLAIEKLQKDKSIRCLLLMYGMPLKIRPPSISYKDKQVLASLKQEKADVEKQDKKSSDYASRLKQLKQSLERVGGSNKRAALDSELALVLTDSYPLEKWLENPYFLGFQKKKNLLKKDKVLMVSRLDASTPAIVRRMINDSIEAEKNGLQGAACFDARWPEPGQDVIKLSGYAMYDKAIHNAARIVKGRMKVSLNQQEQLFKPGDCEKTALYCGWYSLAKYQDSFSWQQGAIAYHIASAECSTLKKSGSQVWCKRMLEKGVAATVGPVYEPYVQGFPLPDMFFGLLVDGYMTLAEWYLVSVPYLSWQMVLLGDPLYKPFQPMQK